MATLGPKPSFPIPESEYDKRLQEILLPYFQELQDIINGGLRFGVNHNVQIISFTTNGTANTEDTVAHTLKRVPVGFILVNSNKAASLYDSGTAWTATNVYLKCNVASAAVKIMVF